MLHKVIKPFPCSWDGITSVSLVEGGEHDFGTMAAGLVAEGWIEPSSSAKPIEAAIDTRPIEAAVVKHAPRERRGK